MATFKTQGMSLTDNCLMNFVETSLKCIQLFFIVKKREGEKRVEQKPLANTKETVYVQLIIVGCKMTSELVESLNKHAKNSKFKRSLQNILSFH